MWGTCWFLSTNSPHFLCTAIHYPHPFFLERFCEADWRKFRNKEAARQSPWLTDGIDGRRLCTLMFSVVPPTESDNAITRTRVWDMQCTSLSWIYGLHRASWVWRGGFFSPAFSQQWKISKCQKENLRLKYSLRATESPSGRQARSREHHLSVFSSMPPSLPVISGRREKCPRGTAEKFGETLLLMLIY